jgi:hypothetical protein
LLTSFGLASHSFFAGSFSETYIVEPTMCPLRLKNRKWEGGAILVVQMMQMGAMM